MSANTDDEDLTRTFSVFSNPAETISTVIVGAGIIGCATAYYLATSGGTKPDTIHLIEASPEIFASASGKAGGFLASDCRFYGRYVRFWGRWVLTAAHRVRPIDCVAGCVFIQASSGTC